MHGIRIVGIGGSLEASSRSLAALRVAMEGVDRAGAKGELFDLRELRLPVYTEEGGPVPGSVNELADACHGAHGLIWSSPTYHGTISGSFKNAIDWLELLARR